jgi:two-component system, cell cycle response regulator
MASVLVIDDSDDVRRRVIKTLRSTELFDTYFEASDGVGGFKILNQESIDLVLCDLVMPRSDGLHFLGMKASRPQLSEVPVLMLTGKDSVDTRVKTLNSGASDFIAKPFHPEELIARTRVHVSLKLLQDELKKKNDLLETLNRTDALTGVYNRRHFLEVLETEHSRTRRGGNTFGFAMLDLDHFKNVNDTYGHLAGDHALVEVAKILCDALRLHDTCSRYGGEEFALILPDTNQEGALTTAERCRADIEAADIVFEGQKLPLTVSMGLSIFESRCSWSREELVAKADAALYESKDSGRNKVTLAQSNAS